MRKKPLRDCPLIVGVTVFVFGLTVPAASQSPAAGDSDAGTSTGAPSVTTAQDEADTPDQVIPDDDPREWKIGYDDGFLIRDPDKMFKLKLNGQLQLRYTTNWRDDDSLDGDFEDDFDARRAKLKATGYVFGPQLRYGLTLAYRSDTDDDVKVESAWGRLLMGEDEDIRLQVGRFRPAFLREQEVSSKRQLAVERSLVANALGSERHLGAAGQWELDGVRFEGGYFQVYDEVWSTDHWFASFRAEALLAGKWSRLTDFTSFKAKHKTVSIGGGVLYESDDRFGSDITDLRLTADATIELGRANLFAAYIVGDRDEDGMSSMTTTAFVLQGGVPFGSDCDLFARYEFGEVDGVDEDLSIITAGFNWYLNEHGLKFTCDAGYGLNGVGAMWSKKGTGWRTDDPDEDGQVVARAQLQFLF